MATRFLDLKTWHRRQLSFTTLAVTAAGQKSGGPRAVWTRLRGRRKSRIWISGVPCHSSNRDTLAPRDRNNIWLTFNGDPGYPTWGHKRSFVLRFSDAVRAKKTQTTLQYSHIQCVRRTNWTAFESSLDCILKQIYINLAHGVSTITFYCGEAINGHGFTFLTTFFTHMNIKERTVKTTHFWKSVKRDKRPITGINFLRIARGHFL